MNKLRTPIFAAIVLGLLAGSAVGVAAQDATDPMAPTVLTGSVTGWRILSPGTRTAEEGFVRQEGRMTAMVYDASDPRLSGDVTNTGHWLVYSESPEMHVEAGSFELVNPGGRWLGTQTTVVGPGIDLPDIIVFSGEGAYEGLTAYVGVDWTTSPATLSGLIFPGAMPALPEPAVTD